MKEGELTLMVMADYSKAFDTVNFKTVLRKMHHPGFSNNFMKWTANYLSNSRQFVQIDDHQSKPAVTHFGVPQGSILGPIIFNIYVSDLKKSIHPDMSRIQYADDTSLYSHCGVKNLPDCLSSISANLANLNAWSSQSNLALNPKKTEAMLFSTFQMASVHSLGELDLSLNISGNTLKRVDSKKLLGVHFHEHLKWNEHVKMTASSCYGTLSTLRKIKHFADFKLRKHLVEALVLSKMDYNDIVFDQLPLYLVKRLQRIQNAATSFVIGRYATTTDAVKIGWLPVQERRKWHLLKTTYKALHDTRRPSYASLEVAKHH